MTDIKPPRPPRPSRPDRATLGFAGWAPVWFTPRTSWVPNPTPPVEYEPGTDVPVLRRGPQRVAEEALVSGKTPVDAPTGLEAAFARTKALLAAILVIGRGVGQSVLEAMGATSKTEGRIRRALQRGVQPEQIAAAFTAANDAQAFADAHYDGGDVWFMLTYPRTIEAALASNEQALVTGDAEEALARLDIGKGYAGNDLAPGAVEAARAAAAGSGYTHPDTFVLAEVGGARAGGGYDDVLKDLTPQEFLDREMQARGRGPSGENRQP